VKLAGIVRAKDWWAYKIPPLLGVAYVLVLVGEVPFRTGAWALAVFLVFLVATASFGYFLNDLCDIGADRLANKRNIAGELSLSSRLAVWSGLLAMVVVPWLWLPASDPILLLVLLELALFVAYAVPPLRLKARGAPALVVDALYAHTVPMLITVLTFTALAEHVASGVALGLVAGWSFLTGFRGILLHQVDDLAGDLKAGSRTAITPGTRIWAVSFVLWFLLPTEVLLLAGLAFLVSTAMPYFSAYAGVVLAILTVRVLREAKRQAKEEPARDRWRLDDDLDGRAGLEAGPEGGIRVVGTERTGNPWDLRLRTHSVVVRAGDRHRLYLRVRSDRERPLELAVTETVAPWATLGPYETMALTPEWQRVVLELPAAPVDTPVCVQLNLGSGIGPVELCDEAFLRVGDSSDLLVDDQARAPDPYDRARAYRLRRIADFLGAWMLNDFYEKWMPLFPLVALSVIDPMYLVVAAAHVLLFRSALPRAW
jgi:4-hydroxybenzoate polyprenyltransferase